MTPTERDERILSLTAENTALQEIIISLLKWMLATPYVNQIVFPVLDNAANFVEHRAIALGDKATPEHGAKALAIIEQIRAVVVGDGPKPKSGV